MRRTALAVLTLLPLVAAPPVARAAPADPPPVVTHRDGITVTGVARVSARTWRIDMTTAAVSSAYATKSGLSVRVTLPLGYATSTTRYPTLYLLPGQDGTSADWTSGQGDAEQLTAGRGVIVVTPDGGKAGWYTDWVRQWGGSQRWETFHVKQLVPFIDGTFRTLASGRHRAVAGLSMGGYGALRYATDHPGAFAHASSYSGAVNLSRPDVRAAVLGSVVKQGLGLDAPFGSILPGLDGVWHAANPLDHAEALRGTGVSLYVGDGRGSAKDAFSNVLEQGSAGAAADLHARLVRLGVPHTWVNYGHDVTNAGYTCDGGHDWPCWNMDLALDLPAIMRDIS